MPFLAICEGLSDKILHPRISDVFYIFLYITLVKHWGARHGIAAFQTVLGYRYESESEGDSDEAGGNCLKAGGCGVTGAECRSLRTSEAKLAR